MRIASKSRKSSAHSTLLGSHPSARHLGCESLESRSLMAADLFDHNFVMPEDTNSGGFVSPIDALVVINALNSRGENTQVNAAVDVNADGSLTPSDALLVINFLNRSRVLGIEEKTSGVDSGRRIQRIEQAIATQTLPNSMELATAQHLLAVLRAGGHPEIGDRMLNGQLTNDLAMSDEELINEAEIAKYVSESRMGLGAPFMDAEQLMAFADTLKSRLEVIGVKSEFSTDIIQEVLSNDGSSLQSVIDSVAARLAELNIDVDAALPERMDVQFSSIVEQLRTAGVNEEEIIAITNDLRAAYESSTPITVDLLMNTLDQFDLDGSIVFPSEADRMISYLTEILGEAGVGSEIISTISSEVMAAYAAGQPLTIEQIEARLIELGISPLAISMVFSNDSAEMMESLRQYFELSGLPGDFIDAILKETESSMSHGESLSLDELLTRLRELGLGVDSGFPGTIAFSIHRS